MPYHIAVARVFQVYVVAIASICAPVARPFSMGLADHAATEAVISSGYHPALLAETYQMQGDTDEAFVILTEALLHME